MIDRQSLEQKIREWLNEFRGLGADGDKLPSFLAGRLVESGMIQLEEDINVVRARLGNQIIPVRIKAFDPLRRLLQYENVEGFGVGLMPVSAVMDNNKLFEIMKRLGHTIPQVQGKSQPNWIDGGKISLDDIRAQDDTE